jgi:hypothetical protein
MVHGLLGMKLINKMNKLSKIKIKVLVLIHKMKNKVKKKAIHKVGTKIKINLIARVAVRRKISAKKDYHLRNWKKEPKLRTEKKIEGKWRSRGRKKGIMLKSSRKNDDLVGKL